MLTILPCSSLNNLVFFVYMWSLLLYPAIILTLCYCVLILVYYKQFMQLRYFEPVTALQPRNRFSIVIPARNEEDNIERCILSILQNNYPSNLFEVIVADDFSTDNTAQIVKNLQRQFANLKLIRLK